MNGGFMTTALKGSKVEIKKANRMANLIVAGVILSFLVVMITIIL